MHDDDRSSLACLCMYVLVPNDGYHFIILAPRNIGQRNVLLYLQHECAARVKDLPVLDFDDERGLNYLRLNLLWI